MAEYQTRFSYYLQQFKNSNVGQKLGNLWSDKIKKYGLKGWTKGKNAVWTLSTAFLIVIIPIGVENLLEGEATAAYLSSQLANQEQEKGQSDYSMRPY